ncbi:MAG: hypothetical protein RIC35_08405 [Marinoscillum sp.]
MHEEIESLYVDVKELVSTTLYNAYKTEIRGEFTRFKGLREDIALIITSSKTLPQKAEAIRQMLTAFSFTEEGKGPMAFSEEAYSALVATIDKLPTIVQIEQKVERFQSQQDDPHLLKISKFFKGFLFNLSDIPRKAFNVFRKSKKPKAYWSHQVPLRAVAKQHLMVDFYSEIVTLRDGYLKDLTSAYTQLLIDSVDNKEPLYESETLNKSLSKSRNRLKKVLIEKLDLCFTSLKDDAEKTGTIELKESHFKDKKIADRTEDTVLLWNTRGKNWNNTFMLLFDEWKSDLELEKLCNQATESLGVYRQSQQKFNNESIAPHISFILDYIAETKKTLDESDDNLSVRLKKSNYKAQKSLDEKVIPKLLEVLGSNNIINAVGRLENTVQQGLKSMTFDFRFAKSATIYDEPIAANNIARISLYELVSFEIVPNLIKKIDQAKSNFLQELNKQITLTGDLDHMITFGLSTAIQQLQETGDSESAMRVAQESLNRSEERVGEIRDVLSALFETTYETLSKALEEYDKALNELMVNENIREMRMRITKAKAIQQTKEYRTQLKIQAVERFEKFKTYTLTQSKEFRESFSSLRQRFILTSKKQTASRAVSDFLSTSQERINSLPVIYKNLYKIEPLTDLELFVGRTSELNQINLAYNTWLSGKMGSAALFGEKWSGLTTLLNYIHTNNTLKHPITRIKCKTSLNTQEQYEHILCNILSEEELPKDDIVERLNNGPKRVIILEDLQNLYLRKTGGFTVIKSLLELISHTSANVFWMISCTVYTWEYFKKTIHIHEIFSYHIPLQNPSEEDLSGIVQKRTRISGYKILFEPDEDDLNSKKFNKMNEEDQQAYLRKRFFKNLIDFSESNISMALMFWLLSTKSVDQNKIIINSFRKPDLSFLEILNMEKILALHALILHDGLSMDQFSEVVRSSHQAAFLNLSMMVEDGILIRNNEQYLVNPMVYRSVISLLKAKNLIYK